MKCVTADAKSLDHFEDIVSDPDVTYHMPIRGSHTCTTLFDTYTPSEIWVLSAMIRAVSVIQVCALR